MSPIPSTRNRDATPESAVGISTGSVLAKRYRIDGIVAEGGMATIYRAWHLLLEQAVAIKVMRPELARVPEAVARFVNEARAAAQVSGPHSLRVIDIGRIENGPPYLVLELLEGEDLRTMLVQRGPLPIGQAVELTMQACAAVSEAHAHGIIHRDLKPENLFLSRAPNGTRVLKLIDFGISKRLVSAGSDNPTAFGESVGSPQYMSPEQMSAPERVDERSDVWSLGVVLFELLTGATPFQAETAPIVFARVIGGEPTPLSRFRRKLPKRLEQIVERCLAKAPEQRFHSVAELARALSRLEPSEGRRTFEAPLLDAVPPQRGARSVAKRAGVLAACAALAAAVMLYSTGHTPLPPAGSVAASMRALIVESVLTQAPR
jgi:serine/threonine protein kinase